MCGICGFNWEDKKTLKEMTDTIVHRGPNQYDYYTDSLVSLGHRRLSIIDLSEKGKQPLCNEKGDVWIVFGGEIYNFKEIKKDLESKGHVFKSDTDTEVIVHGYEEYGIDCIKFFNGMFAFAIWDSRNKKIVLARDRLGVKPLYYYFDNASNKFIFASEIKSIISNPVVKREFNISAFNQLINYGYIINGETLIKNVRELLPGHYMVYDFKDLQIKKYWELKNNIQPFSEQYFVEKLRKMLKESVRKRLVADVPLGASLSGGIDSGSVVAFMSQIADKPVQTFTVGFNDESDEFKEARQIADFCKTNHHEKIVNFSEISKNFPKILWHMEVPFAKPAVFANFFLSKEINRNNVIVDLSGEGSDELFGGYNRYGVYLNNNLSNMEKAEKIDSSFFTSLNERNNFFDKSILEMNHHLKPEKKFLPDLEKENHKEHLNSALNFELKNQLHSVQLKRVDKMSMAHSHEVRVPFLDYEFVEFGMTIPSNLKWKDNSKKYILQKAMEPFLPKETVGRLKLPFHMPLLKYFQKDFTDIAGNILSNPSISRNGFVKQEKITELIRKIKFNEVNDDESLRKILFLTSSEMFNKLFIEKGKIKENDLNMNNFI